MGDLAKRDEKLVALGAAIASNCIPCIEYYVPEARRAGFSDGEIRHAVRIADKVRRVPSRAVLEAALARLGESPDASAETGESQCSCTESAAGSGADCSDQMKG